MKKLSIALMVIMAAAQLMGHAQFTIKPFTLTTVSYIHPFQLPVSPLIKTVTIPKRTQGVGPSTNDICPTSCSVALPVTLLELSGNRLNNNEVLLNWKTQNEVNSKGFNIERSLDGGMAFITIGTKASDTSKTTEKKYTLTDLNSFAQTSYYRVKQMDVDGRYTYSNTISIAGYNLQQKAVLSPNPANNYSVLSCFSSSSGKGNIVITSAHGQKITEIPWAINAGGNTLQIPLAKYAAGFYYVQLTWPDGYNTVMKLVVR